MRLSIIEADAERKLRELELTVAAGKNASKKVLRTAVRNVWVRNSTAVATVMLDLVDSGAVKLSAKSRKALSEASGREVGAVRRAKRSA